MSMLHFVEFYLIFVRIQSILKTFFDQVNFIIILVVYILGDTALWNIAILDFIMKLRNTLLSICVTLTTVNHFDIISHFLRNLMFTQFAVCILENNDLER